MIASSSFSVKGWTVTAKIMCEGRIRTFSATKPALKEAEDAVMLQIDHVLVLGEAYPDTTPQEKPDGHS